MILTGIARIGRDAEINYLANGTAVCNLSLVFNYGKKKDDGSRDSQWIDAALFGVRASKLHQYLLKGTQISVVMSDPHYSTFTKIDGTVLSKLVANVIDLEFVGSKELKPESPAPKYTPKLQVTRPFDELDELADLDNIPF